MKASIPLGAGGPEAVGQALAVGDRHHAVCGQPLVVRFRSDAEDVGAFQPQQLDDDGADPTGRRRHGDGLARLEVDRPQPPRRAVHPTT